jgi:parallel beta-helix repeat protein
VFLREGEMRKKVFYGIVLSLVLVDTLLLGFGTQQKMLTSKTWYVGPSRQFTSIQEAINYENVSNGDIICVDWQQTPYYENVIVNKSLIINVYEQDRIRGYYPVVDGGNSKGAVFNVTVDGVEINGFIIRHGKYGILLTSSSNNILNNMVDSNIYGIFIDEKSAMNTLRANKIAGNGWNFGVAQYSRWNESLPLNHFIQDINQSNTVDGKPIYYWINRISGQLPYDAGYLAIVNSTGITAENLLHLQRNYQGILVAYSSQIIVKNCKCLFPSTDLQYGITFINVTDSIIQNATFLDISNCILLEDSRDNLIQDNKIFSTSTSRHCECGIDLEFSNNNIVNDNLVETYYEWLGIDLMDCLNNSIIANNITRTYQAIWIEKSNGSIIFHNNFLDEWPQAKVSYDSFINKFE